MGEKGAKADPAGQQAAAALVDELQPLGDVRSKKMFGGNGVFADGVMFAIVDSGGRCFLRADAATSPRFEGLSADKHGKMPYWEIPAQVRADPDGLLEWAATALAVARAAK